MADIELVIKIPESTYKVFKNLSKIIGVLVYEKDILTLIKAVKNGTPLPKGHGRLIGADELLKAMDTWDKFGNIPNRGLIPLRTSALQGIYVTYVKYDDMVKCVKGMPSVTPQEPIHGKCNQCKHYEGVHNVQGHAPCSYHKIGGVMCNWYCSQFESGVEDGNSKVNN